MSAQPTVWRAPGKLILLGEYAVLDGAPALVVAVDRDVRCAVTPDAGLRVDAGQHGAVDWPVDRGATPLPLVRALLARLADPPPGRYRLDSDALYADTADGRRKLGLGSSAATTVALAAALRAEAQPDPAAIYRLAQEVHRAVQGTGSGADVAASSFGGALAYRWLDDPAKAPLDALSAGDGAGHATPLRAPDTPLWAVWSGDSASTVALVGQVAEWARRDPAGHRRRIAELGFAARAGIDAWQADDRAGLAAAAEAGRRAIVGLGRDAKVELCTALHRGLHRAAARHGAGVKPTGAGGGDLAWIYAAEPAAEAAAAKALEAAGHPVFRLTVAAGVERLG